MFGRPPVAAAAMAATAANAAKPTRTRTILRTCSSLSRVTAVGTHKGSLRIGFLAALAVAVALVAPMGGLAGSRQALKGATVQTRNIRGPGTVLVNSRGFTLYMFAPDK